jgi:hypothetical protein
VQGLNIEEINKLKEIYLKNLRDTYEMLASDPDDMRALRDNFTCIHALDIIGVRVGK